MKGSFSATLSRLRTVRGLYLIDPLGSARYARQDPQRLQESHLDELGRASLISHSGPPCRHISTLRPYLEQGSIMPHRPRIVSQKEHQVLGVSAIGGAPLSIG